MREIRRLPVLLVLALSGGLAVGGVLDPDCTAEKAAKSTAMRATVGVGGRCTPAEAAKDTARDAVGIEKKGPIEKRTDNDGPLKKGGDKWHRD
jgi:hypothetical protein